MFTGIVQTRGTLTDTQPTEAGRRLWIDRHAWQPQHARPVVHGDSICCNGVCLTVAELDGTRLAFDVITQTLNLTNLGGLGVGDRVNLEPSVTPQQPMGGHFLQGHIDARGEVVELRDDPADWRATFRLTSPDPLAARSLVPRGSIAVDGVSLTIADAPEPTEHERERHEGRFTIALIPTTLRETTLGTLSVGDTVNLETDVLARVVLRAATSLGTLHERPADAHLT